MENPSPIFVRQDSDQDNPSELVNPSSEPVNPSESADFEPAPSTKVIARFELSVNLKSSLTFLEPFGVIFYSMNGISLIKFDWSGVNFYLKLVGGGRGRVEWTGVDLGCVCVCSLWCG